MKFTVVLTDKNFYEDISKEFKKDKIILLDDDLIKVLLDGTDNLSLEDKDILIKIRLIEKYKNLIFIDNKFLQPLVGLRDEILHLKKVRVKLFLQNIRSLSNCNIFYSKKCISLIKDMLYIFSNSKDIEYLKKSYLFKKDVCNYEFNNVSWDF